MRSRRSRRSRRSAAPPWSAAGTSTRPPRSRQSRRPKGLPGTRSPRAAASCNAPFGDDVLDGDLLPSAQRAADFLLGTIEQDVLPVATTDLWEEREGQHAFTAASTVGGLRAAGAMARRHELRWPSGT